MTYKQLSNLVNNARQIVYVPQPDKKNKKKIVAVEYWNADFIEKIMKTPTKK